MHNLIIKVNIFLSICVNMDLLLVILFSLIQALISNMALRRLRAQDVITSDVQMKPCEPFSLSPLDGALDLKKQAE